MVHNGQYVYPMAYVTERQSALLDAKTEPEMGKLPIDLRGVGQLHDGRVYLVPFGRYTCERACIVM